MRAPPQPPSLQLLLPLAVCSVRHASSRRGIRTWRVGPANRLVVAAAATAANITTVAGLRGRCFQAGLNGNLPLLAGITAYRLDWEEPSPLSLWTAEESGSPKDGQQPAALKVQVPVTSGCGNPITGTPARPST